MSITPLNSVLITAKPLVLSNDVHIILKISEESRKNGFLMTDGQFNMEVTKDMKITITGSKYNTLCIIIPIL
jgi:NAD kinase